MFCIEILLVDGKPLYCLRSMQGNPILSTFDINAITLKVVDVADDIVEKSKNMKTNSDKS